MTTWTLITGASEGLGVEFARLAARNGRNMILTARSEDKLQALATELRSPEVDVVVIPADLNDMAQVNQMWAQASKDRQIDYLINNAGLGSKDAFADAESWDRELASINVNMLALTQLMKLAIAHMAVQRSGRILNVASVAAFVPGPNMAVYHATKAYVLSLSEAVRHELRGTGITVTALCPGATQTQFFEAADMTSARILKLSPPARADQVAEAGWKGALAGRAVVVPGLLNKLSAFMPRLSPRAITVSLTAFIMAKEK